MKQLHLFNDIEQEVEKNELHEWILFVDGASRGNPGPSGAGIYIEKNKILFIKEGYFLGKKTNNQAEYLALLLGLFTLKDHISKNDSIKIISDSQLLVHQLNGIYKVKNIHLLPLYQLCKQMIHQLNATVSHVLRDENTQADVMANQGIDHKTYPPKKYNIILEHHGIHL